ncbi:hypothetical protein L596_019067 [Steinernema carpocapsae]|uniref:Mre11 DNA-binding domain-containing protein n=1 Tax=Steinernema carpocapsae TaxID=34508 RepID=A0A4U5N6J4_STECR|nr:hypothetical protein L596_019067 [Steinernema carpocapsae]
MNTFEEILQKAIKYDADFVLLAGDLFHENNPSREIFLGVSRKLRQHCLSSRPVNFEFVSDPSKNFSSSNFDRVNYDDPNINVGLPVFTIHGNHDDLSGKGLSVLDNLHEVGLLNQFGKFETLDKFSVEPILLRKGNTNLALYGIGNQRDDRLCRAFQGYVSDEQIHFRRPAEHTEAWFNILLLHQNRPKRSTVRTTGAYVNDKLLPSFFDLVIWGHEHECKIDPEYVESGRVDGDGFFILQPGSSIATSLTKDEAIPKHIALLKVRGRKFVSKPIPLETVRQLFVDELNFELDYEDVRIPNTTIRQDRMPDERIVHEKIESMLEEADASRGPHQPTLPLLRLKIIYSGRWTQFPPLNAKRFGVTFADRVANYDEMIQIKTIRQQGPKDQTQGTGHVGPAVVDRCLTVDQLVSDFFTTCDQTQKMKILTETAMGRSISEYSNEDKKVAELDREFIACVKTQVETFRQALIETDEVSVPADYTMDLHQTEKRLMKKIAVATDSRSRARVELDDDEMETD